MQCEVSTVLCKPAANLSGPTHSGPPDKARYATTKYSLRFAVGACVTHVALWQAIENAVHIPWGDPTVDHSGGSPRGIHRGDPPGEPPVSAVSNTFKTSLGVLN